MGPFGPGPAAAATFGTILIVRALRRSPSCAGNSLVILADLASISYLRTAEVVQPVSRNSPTVCYFAGGPSCIEVKRSSTLASACIDLSFSDQYSTYRSG